MSYRMMHHLVCCSGSDLQLGARVSGIHQRDDARYDVHSSKGVVAGPAGVDSSKLTWKWLSKLWSPLESLNTRCCIILRTQMGTIILTTTHMEVEQGLSGLPG